MYGGKFTFLRTISMSNANVETHKEVYWALEKADYAYMKNSIYLKITIKVLLKIYSLSNVQYLYLVNLNS